MNEIPLASGSSIPNKSMAKNSSSSLSLDRAAFLLIRIKRVFQKKKQKLKLSKRDISDKTQPMVRKSKPPMLRARTLPAIIPPALNIIQAQFEPSINDRDSIAELPSDEIKSQYLLHESQYKYSLSVVDSDSYASKSPGVSPRHSVSSTSSTSSANKDSNKKSVSFAKLTKLLSTQPKDKYSKGTEPQLPYNTANDVSCFFWNTTRPNDKVKRSGSVDSLIDAQQNSTKNDINIVSIGTHFSLNPTDNCAVNRRDKLISSGFSNRFKDHLAISSTSSVQLFESHQNLHDIPLSPTGSFRISKTLSGRRQASVDVFIPEDLPFMTKSEKKKFEKYNKFNFDVQAMFSSVENEQLDRTRMIIESTDVDINSYNSDGFSPLDIAVMTLNIPLIKLLQSYGSRESSNFLSKESREKQLNALLKEAERCVLDLNLTVFGVLTNGGLSAALLKEKERQLLLWERRLKLLQRMKIGFDRLEPPESPSSVQLEVVGKDCLRLKFCGPVLTNEKKCIVTKYKVEWSRDNFLSIDGTLEITDLQKLEVLIDKLESGQNYSVRVASGNGKGFSNYSYPSPISAIPSSWRDVDQKPSLNSDNLSKLDQIYRQIIDCRQHNCPQLKVLSIESETSYHQRKGQVRKSIKNLFGSTPKFQKAMKRGIYLSCLIYNEDRILVTNDEILPVVEIDDVYPSSLQNDFYWMLKISSTWEDVKALRRELDKSQSSSVAHFRSKILSAVEQMQTSLGIQDLGKLFYKPLKDSDSTTVLCTIKKLVDMKSLNCLSLRWLPIGKLQKKLFNSNTSNTSEPSHSSPLISDLLLSSLQEMICYHKACNNPLPRGLYLGFVKLKTSVEMMSIVVPQHNPNVIPHIKIRDNPHVSKEEWNCLKDTLNSSEQKIIISTESPQLKFLQLMSKSSNFLLNSMKILENEIPDHRVYDIEVIELSSDVSFVLLLPPVENVCSIFGQSDELAFNSNLIYLPLRIFEMINLNTYQQTFVSRYSRISALLEMDILVAQQAQREAFSSSEVMTTKSRVTQLQEYQTILEEFWRSKRWIMNVVTFARDKQSIYGISLQQINHCLTNCNVLLDEESLFQIPTINLSSPTYESPVSSPPPHPTSRRPSRDDSSIDTNYFTNQLKINTSSSYSLIDSLYFMNSDYKSETYCEKSYDDMRRCVSASKLINGSIRTNSSNRGHNRAFNQRMSHPIHLSDELIRNTKFQNNGDSNQWFASNMGTNNESEKQLFSDNMFRPIVLSNINESHDSSDQSIKQINDFHNESNSCRPPNISDNFPVIESKEFCDISAKNETSLIRIYVAYDCGLPLGTSVKLQVTDQTTVKEIIELVVTHLNSMIEMKGQNGPIYHSKDFYKFCLIAVFSSNVKHLNEDFKIVNLQTPWNKAKICIKIKDNFYNDI